QDLPPMDWQRHDPAEKAFYNGIVTQMDRFKKSLDWESMQKGILGEGLSAKRKHSPGTTQLDSFIESPEGLTGQMPPELVIEDNEPVIEVEDSQYDEEDRMYNEEWPDIDEYVKSDLADDVNKPITVLESPASNKSDDDKHMAAMELAPSKTKTNKITEFTEVIPEKIEDSQEATEDEMIRIKIIQSLPDAVMLGDGVELILEADDVHFIDKDTADWLVESGVAEVENL
ncbi:MAG: hypothetical protein L7T81_05385, partial [Candidatus Poseidoniaceae archaeon]|nr:hypothetical protein [Candidatus Poseidoniaceae archaeon]